jgi:hypothetical protein
MREVIERKKAVQSRACWNRDELAFAGGCGFEPTLLTGTADLERGPPVAADFVQASSAGQA